MVYNQFMDAIVSGEWKPGERIPSENTLTKELKVSRVSVRSALQKLTGLGLVESRQGEGTFVCYFSGAQYINTLVPMVVFEQSKIQHLMEFRKILDSEVAALAAERATIGEIEQLKENYTNHMAASKSMEKCAKYDAEFHCMLGNITHNPLLSQIYKVFNRVFRKNMFEIVSVMGAEGAKKYHEQIIEAVENRDSELARRYMNAHVQETIESLLNHSVDGETDNVIVNEKEGTLPKSNHGSTAES